MKKFKSVEIKEKKVITTKKRGYPSILKSAGISLKSAGIWSKFLSRGFFSRRFRPLLFECGDRVVWTCTSAFQKRQYSLYENVNITYTSAFESTGIGSTYSNAFKNAGLGGIYSNAFKNAGIGYIHFFVKTVPTQVKTPEQGLKSAWTYLGTFEKRWYRY